MTTPTNQPTIREICEEFRRLDDESNKNVYGFWKLRRDEHSMKHFPALVAEVERLQQENEKEPQPDSVCVESDGCPTENAVLQREWRRLQKRAENVSIDEANELRDILRTLVPTGRAFITSARELVDKWEKQKLEISALQKRVGELEEDGKRLDWMAAARIEERRSAVQMTSPSEEGTENNLRSAIDAARAQKGEQ